MGCKNKIGEKVFLILISLLIIFCLILLINQFSVSGRVVDTQNWCEGADINQDGVVNQTDLEIFDNYYRSKDCVAEDWCGGSDLNRDGIVDVIDFNILSKNYGQINCFVSDGDCVPNLYYENWSECSVVYNFEDLLNKVVILNGQQSRVYRDTNGCVEAGVETRACSVELDVFAERVEWCGEEYFEIYEMASGKLLSRIKDNKQESVPSLDILFAQGDVEDTCKTYEKPLPVFEVKDYGNFIKLGLLALFIGFIIVYFLVSRNFKKEEQFIPALRPLKRAEIGEKEEFFS